MHWRDQGCLLSSRRHGEKAAILEVFTANNGRHIGLLRGGASQKMTATIQPGTQVMVEWRARLSEQLGIFTIEPVKSRVASLMGDRFALAALASACALLVRILPERAPVALFYSQTVQFMDRLAGGHDWMEEYLHWEIRLLQEAGRGLDLSRCVVSGEETGLRYVSPRTGRAVTATVAGEWKPRLLELPECFVGGKFHGISDFAVGLRLTGHFIEQVLCDGNYPEKAMAARLRLQEVTTKLLRSSKQTNLSKGQ